MAGLLGRIVASFTALVMAAGLLVAIAASPAGAVPGANSPVFINEIHYDNTGTDTGEFIEIAGPAGTDLSTWSIVLYNGNGGAVYNTTTLAGTIPDEGGGFGAVAVTYPTNGIQNGSPDGVALVDGGTVVQFLSYEGTFNGVGGPANGLTSTDIGVSEPSGTAIGDSLQLTGTGTLAGDFSWNPPAPESPGLINTGQTFGEGGGPGDPIINEFVANHTGSDTDEFVEILGDPGTDYSDFAVLEIEGDTAPGTIDDAFAVGTTGTDGRFTTGPAPLGIENGTITLLLVEDFTGSVGDDIDTDDDGVIDNPQWSRIVDDVAASDGGSSDLTYSSTVLGTAFSGGPFAPGGASRIPDGTDSDAVADWVRNHFGGQGLPSFPGATAPPGEAINTPNAPNEVATAPPPQLEIWEIQGSGQFSAFVGQTVETRGVVTLVDSSGTDAWIQTPTADSDGDPATSDGILIDDYSSLAGPPPVGSFIVIQGEVEEQQFGNQLPRTRIDDTVLISSDPPSTVPVPAPVPLVDLPDESIPDGEAFWEALEGMLVSVEDATVVAPTSRFGEFGMLTQADAVPGSGFFASVNQILLRSTGPNQVDYNPERILVDDDGQVDTPDVRPGDTVNDAIGVVDYTFGAYKLQLSDLDIDIAPLPASPVSTRDGPRNSNTTITTFNVENLFDRFDNPLKDDQGSTPSAAALESQLRKLALAIELELLLPEIMILQEVENTFIAQELGNRVNAATGTDYVATSFETSDGRGIEVAFLWDADRVDLLEAFQLSGPDVEAAFGPSSPSPGREPLYGLFRIGQDEVHIVGNHFKSKGGDDPIFGVSFNRITEVQRKAQAQVVRDFVEGLLAADRKAMVMVAGDLNDFQFGEPGEGPDHPVAILEGVGGGPTFTNLIYEEPEDERWSFIFDGNSQVLDYILVNDRLHRKLREVDFLHFNAGFPAGADDDDTTTLRAADHDPLEGRFQFAGVGAENRKNPVRDSDTRFATFNASLNRFNAGDLINDLSTPLNSQAANVAETIQRTRPDVLLINEFDFDAGGVAAQLFQDNYLSVSQMGALPIHYPYRYVAASNTGVPSGFDLDNNSSVGGPGDAFGFGFFEGQFAFVVYSMHPIDTANIRTFQNFLWRDMPGNLIPAGFYDPAELDVFRLSSKNHVDLPIEIGEETVHFLVSHPTPPVFDGPEDRNGTRNHDEIRFWADYVTGGATAAYIYDDGGTFGGLGEGDLFVIAGDQNADPFDGDSVAGAAQQLLDHPLVNTSITPSSPGGPEQAVLQGGANASHLGDPAFDTADFSDSAPGNLRVDYVLPSAQLELLDAEVFWPLSSDPLFRLVGTFPFPTSDHRLVWIDVEVDD